MADDLIHVTEAESEVLAALWMGGPMSPTKLVEAVQARKHWGNATVKTLIGRLMRKKAIRSERDDGRLLYYPLITREAFLRGEVQGLVDRLFDGAPQKLGAFINRNWPPH